MTREEAIDVLKKTLAYESDFAEAKRMAIDALQTEVVRCKECRFYIANEGKCTRTIWVYDWHRPKTNADDFCSYGEREGE